MPSKSVFQKTPKSLLSRFYPTNSDDLKFIQEVCGSENLHKNPPSLEDKLEEAIQPLANKQCHNSNTAYVVTRKKTATL